MPQAIIWNKAQFTDAYITVFQITASPSAWSRQLWGRTGNFFKTFLQFYVYDLRFKAAGLTTYLIEFWTLHICTRPQGVKKHKHIGSCKLYSSKTRTGLSCMVDIMAADDLALQEARASPAKVLTKEKPKIFKLSTRRVKHFCCCGAKHCIVWTGNCVVKLNHILPLICLLQFGDQ